MTASALGPGEALPADAVEVGRIVGPWGIKGGLRVVPHAAEPQALLSSRRWFVQLADAAPVLLKITLARAQGDVVVATAQDLPDRNAAEALKGARVFVSRASFPTAGSDEYYWIDLIGLQVVTREGVLLGSVVDLLATGPHSVLRVRSPEVAAGTPAEEAERLIPFVAAYVDDVDLAARRITVDWGLDF